MPRDSSGNYTLPGAYNPVVPNTTILADWANISLADIASGITDSLDRSGRGGMLAALKATDGTVSAPGITFSSQTTLGIYRAGSNQIAVTVASTQRQVWTSTGTDITGDALYPELFLPGQSRWPVSPCQAILLLVELLR